MKVGILTHYNVNNQGAQLQMYALTQFLKEEKCEPIILTYNKNFDFTDESIQKRNIITLKSIPYIIKDYLLKQGIGLTYFNYKKYVKNNKFRINHFKYEKYSKAGVDIAIVGSDEVFSIETGINIMMYGHGVDAKYMVSYAPSFGQTNIEKLEKYHVKQLVASGLQNFKFLSSRDENTKEVIKKLTDRNAEMVIDPVLLYRFDKNNIKVKLPKKKYILIYAYDKNMIEKNEVEAIKSYAKLNNLITVSAGTYHKWCDKNISCNCLEWIEYFKNAEMVITDTFHGTIVATITQKPLAVYIRNTINKNKMEYLLKQLKLEDRRMDKISKENLENVFRKKIDYNEINYNLEILRQESKKYLKNALGESNEG